MCIPCITHPPMTFLTHYLKHATSSNIMCIPCITHHPMTFLTQFLHHATSSYTMEAAWPCKSLMTLCTTHPLAINYSQWPELCARSAACQACRVCQQKLRGPLHTRWSGWNDLVTVMVPRFILSLLSPPSPSVKFTTSSFQTSYKIKMASNINVIFIYAALELLRFARLPRMAPGM